MLGQPKPTAQKLPEVAYNWNKALETTTLTRPPVAELTEVQEEALLSPSLSADLELVARTMAYMSPPRRELSSSVVRVKVLVTPT